MNRILVIDDLRSFPALEADDANHVTYARTSAEGIAALAASNFEEIWLDHDLGGKDTIRPVVVWLEEHRPDSIEIVRILTDNPVGRDYILAALERYTWTIQGRTRDGRWYTLRS